MIAAPAGLSAGEACAVCEHAPSYEEISQRAYLIALEQGGGDKVTNWLQAERDRRAQPGRRRPGGPHRAAARERSQGAGRGGPRARARARPLAALRRRERLLRLPALRRSPLRPHRRAAGQRRRGAVGAVPGAVVRAACRLTAPRPRPVPCCRKGPLSSVAFRVRLRLCLYRPPRNVQAGRSAAARLRRVLSVQELLGAENPRQYGGPSDEPVVGDWNGSTSDGIGVFTPLH